MTFDKPRALHVAGILETTGPHQHYPTDAEIQEAAALLREAAEEVRRVTGLYEFALSQLDAADAEAKQIKSERRRDLEAIARHEKWMNECGKQRDSLQRDLAAAREECERYRALLATPCDTEVKWHNNGRGARVVFEVGSDDYVVTAERAQSLGAALIRTAQAALTTASKEAP